MIKPIFTATRIFLDEDTQVEEKRGIAILWASVIFVEDVTYLWPKENNVVSLTLDSDEKVHILASFEYIISRWEKYRTWIDRLTMIGIN